MTNDSRIQLDELLRQREAHLGKALSKEDVDTTLHLLNESLGQSL